MDVNGNMLGVLPTDQARRLAQEQGLDLVEISPGAEPPVCRIMDFGKFRFEEAKKEKAARKKQHALSVKEVKFHVTTEEHDYQTKLNNVRRFLEKGHKVKLTLFFRGRENIHRDLGFQLIGRVFKDSVEVGAVEMAPKLIGRGIFGVIAPKSAVKSGPSPVGTRPVAPAPPRPAPAPAGAQPVAPVQPRPAPAAASAGTTAPAATPAPAKPAQQPPVPVVAQPQAAR